MDLKTEMEQMLRNTFKKNVLAELFLLLQVSSHQIAECQTGKGICKVIKLIPGCFTETCKMVSD